MDNSIEDQWSGTPLISHVADVEFLARFVAARKNNCARSMVLFNGSKGSLTERKASPRSAELQAHNDPTGSQTFGSIAKTIVTAMALTMPSSGSHLTEMSQDNSETVPSDSKLNFTTATLLPPIPEKKDADQSFSSTFGSYTRHFAMVWAIFKFVSRLLMNNNKKFEYFEEPKKFNNSFFDHAWLTMDKVESNWQLLKNTIKEKLLAAADAFYWFLFRKSINSSPHLSGPPGQINLSNIPTLITFCKCVIGGRKDENKIFSDIWDEFWGSRIGSGEHPSVYASAKHMKESKNQFQFKSVPQDEVLKARKARRETVDKANYDFVGLTFLGSTNEGNKDLNDEGYYLIFRKEGSHELIKVKVDDEGCKFLMLLDTKKDSKSDLFHLPNSYSFYLDKKDGKEDSSVIARLSYAHPDFYAFSKFLASKNIEGQLMK